MTARFCQYCGRPVAPNASFCPSCGAAIGGVPAAPSPPGTPPPLTFSTPTPYSPYAPYAPYPSYPQGYPGPGGAAPSHGAADRFALSSVSLAAIIGLVGAVLSVVGYLFTPALSVFGGSAAGSGTSISVDLTGLYVLIAVGAVGLLFSLVELWLYRRAFRTLAPNDPRFSTPASLTLLALVALVLLALVAVALVGEFYEAIQCAGSGNAITSACLNFGAALGLLALVGVLAIILFVGYIGLLIGIWRLGTRYGEGLFKAGAVLLIFPFLSFIGLILILVAARSASGKIPGGSSAATFG